VTYTTGPVTGYTTGGYTTGGYSTGATYGDGVAYSTNQYISGGSGVRNGEVVTYTTNYWW